MSTPISRFAKSITAFALAGCAGVADVGRAAPERLVVPDARVVIAGPPGYCIDRAASELRRGGGAFVLLGSCAAISSNARAPKPATPGLLTVTISDGAPGKEAFAAGLPELAAFIDSPEGRAALSRTGDPEAVRVLDTRIVDGALYIHAVDSSGAERGISPEYWRALVGLNDRVLTLSVVGFADAPLSSDDGLSTLDALAGRIRSETAHGGTAG